MNNQYYEYLTHITQVNYKGIPTLSAYLNIFKKRSTKEFKQKSKALFINYHIMEIVIIICLLAIIILQLEDKMVIKWKSSDKPIEEKTPPNLPDIVGKSKPVQTGIESSSSPTPTLVKQKKIPQKQLESDYNIKEKRAILNPEREPNQILNNIPNLAEEEEALREQMQYDEESGFAEGVTFEELSSIGDLLQKEKLEQKQKETVVAIVQKIQGTELFTLLENAIENASQNIADLLDHRLSSSVTKDYSAIFHKKNLNDFDINDFI